LTEPARVRRTVTVVFADVVASTTLAEQLDHESLHVVLDRYSEACAAAVERHGGTVEKFIGDAILGLRPAQPPRGRRPPGRASRG
jgi:class 3 adenylate cyclase